MTRSRQRQWQIRQIAAGRCCICGEKVSKRNKKFCEYHRRRDLDHQRARRVRQEGVA